MSDMALTVTDEIEQVVQKAQIVQTGINALVSHDVDVVAGSGPVESTMIPSCYQSLGLLLTRNVWERRLANTLIDMQYAIRRFVPIRQ